ncbi:MAG: Rab5-interacting family protein [Thaumarchaeota archaeon]|nr:Rab5-interacting family protein [Nitrososphaerota archaeon]
MSLKIYLVRHPKGKDNDKKPEPNDTPAKDAPPEEPRTMETDESRIKSGLDKVFWLRVGLGILAGTISAIIGSTMSHAHERAYTGLGIVIVLFIISYGIAKSLRVPLPSSDKRKLVMTGIGSYFLMFLVSWILVYTIINPYISIGTVH